MLIDFRWEAVGQRSTGWWWQKHSWNEWRQVVTAGKAVAATEEAAQATPRLINYTWECVKKHAPHTSRLQFL